MPLRTSRTGRRSLRRKSLASPAWPPAGIWPSPAPEPLRGSVRHPYFAGSPLRAARWCRREPWSRRIKLITAGCTNVGRGPRCNREVEGRRQIPRVIGVMSSRPPALGDPWVKGRLRWPKRTPTQGRGMGAVGGARWLCRGKGGRLSAGGRAPLLTHLSRPFCRRTCYHAHGARKVKNFTGVRVHNVTGVRRQ